jgi:hypothetical protein
VQPLGLNASQLKAYHAHVLSSHDFRITAEVCDTAGRVLQVQETLLDGQVNIQRGNGIRRTASLTFFDPDHRLGLDPDSPFGDTMFLDRMVKVVHTVAVPGVGRVPAVVFIGPIATVSRDGDTVAVEAQDKAAFAIRGRPPLTMKKGTNAVAAIRAIMAATGERRFRLPTSSRRLPKAYSVGWSDDAAPWFVAQRIASQVLGMQLLYSADGFLLLRRTPAQSVVTLTGAHLTAPVNTAYDVTAAVNSVRVEGTKKPKKKAKQDKTSNTKPEKIATTAVLKARHPMSPARLGRSGAPRYLPLLVTGEQYKASSDAAKRAQRLLREQSTNTTAAVSLSALPLHHLDADDLISVQAPDTSFRIRFAEGSIPLGVGGDMSIGAQKRVSAGRRR